MAGTPDTTARSTICVNCPTVKTTGPPPGADNLFPVSARLRPGFPAGFAPPEPADANNSSPIDEVWREAMAK